MPTRSSLGVDRILSRYTLLLKNQDKMYVGDKCLPVATVNHPRGKYYTVAPGFSYASPGHGLLRNSGAAFRRVTTDVTQSDLFDLKEYGVESFLDDIDREFAGSDALDLRQAATEIAFQKAMIERERDFADLLFSTTTFSGALNTSVGGSSQWDNAASNPLDQVDAAAEKIRQSTGIPRSELSMLLGAKVWEACRKNAALTDFYKNVVAGATTLDEATVASALGIKEIIVGRSVGNTAKEGQAVSMADIWGKFALVFHKVDNPRPLTPHGIGATFSMAGRQAGRVERYREEPRNEVILVSYLEDRVVTNASAGHLFTTVVA
tara:strand:+ start:360 stop:1322 length:963 start_codon:yes stop_codon:yes gene_type:complete